MPGLTARENISLGQEPSRVSFIPRQKETDLARKLFQRIGVEIDPDACAEISPWPNSKLWRSPRRWRRMPASS